MNQQTPDTSGNSGTHNTHSPEYDAVDLPHDKPRSEWSYIERRAEILDLIRESGHPESINQSELAEKYECDQSTISRDIDRIGSSLKENLNLDRHFATVDSTLNRAIRGLIDEGEYRKAASVALEYDNWIHETIEREQFRERIERLESIIEGQQ